MSESYIECLVKAKGSPVFKILRFLMYVLAGVGLVSMFLGSGILGVLCVLAFGVGGYYVGMLADVEYEYLYMDKEISVDRILAQSRRKRMDTYSMDRVEIMAPVISSLFSFAGAKLLLFFHICKCFTNFFSKKLAYLIFFHYLCTRLSNCQNDAKPYYTYRHYFTLLLRTTASWSLEHPFCV